MLHLDLHTGLGRWADYQLLLEDQARNDHIEWAQRRFGAEKVQPSNPDGIAYRSRGGFGPWSESLRPGARHDYFCAEFGTAPPSEVFGALRAENQAQHWCPPGAPRLAAAQDRLKEAFAPSSPAWRAQTVHHALGLIHQALAVSAAPT